MFDQWYLDVALILFILIVVLLLMAVRNEQWRLNHPWEASFIKAKPGTWRWHLERIKLGITGGIPKRS